MGKRKAVWGRGGGKGRWYQKAARNKAKLNKKEETQNSNKNKNKQTKPTQESTALSD